MVVAGRTLTTAQAQQLARYWILLGNSAQGGDNIEASLDTGLIKSAMTTFDMTSSKLYEAFREIADNFNANKGNFNQNFVIDSAKTIGGIGSIARGAATQAGATGILATFTAIFEGVVAISATIFVNPCDDAAFSLLHPTICGGPVMSPNALAHTDGTVTNDVTTDVTAMRGTSSGGVMVGAQGAPIKRDAPGSTATGTTTVASGINLLGLTSINGIQPGTVVSGTTPTFSADYYSVGKPGSPGWVCDPDAMKNWNFSPSNCIQSGGTYDYTDQNQTCGCGSSGASGSAAMPTAPAAPSVPVVPPVITGGGFTTSYEPWAIYIQGTNLTGTMQARLVDGNNSWGTQPTKLAADGTWLSLHVPSDATPTGSNFNKTTPIIITLSDPKTGATSNAYTLQMPPAPLAAIVADAGSAPSAPAASGAPGMTNGGVVTSFTPWAVWVAGSNLNSNTHARVMDGTSQWGADLPMVLSGSTGGSFTLPSDYMPSGCNVGPSDDCSVKVKLVDSATGLIGASYKLAIPRPQ
jgi:hypothetical protein